MCPHHSVSIMLHLPWGAEQVEKHGLSKGTRFIRNILGSGKQKSGFQPRTWSDQLTMLAVLTPCPLLKLKQTISKHLRNEVSKIN